MLRIFRRSSSNSAQAQQDDPFATNGKDWHPDALKGRLLLAEEKLHLQKIWQRISRLWLILGNLALLATAILSSIFNDLPSTRYVAYIYLAAITSVVASPIVTYLHYKRTRQTILDIKRLNLYLRRALTEQLEASTTPNATPLAQQKRYRDEMLDVISQFRDEANRNRRVHNRFQAIVIVGSVIGSAITTASVSFNQTRWAAVAVSATVGIAAGFTGYFKYHERSFSSQQAADSIEREYEAVELRIGRYRNMDDNEAYSEFAEAVERIRDEQSKRQQQLDQPAQVKREEQ